MIWNCICFVIGLVFGFVIGAVALSILSMGRIDEGGGHE